MRFLLAIAHNKFEDNNIENFIKPIENFINMINTNTVLHPDNEDVLEAICDSIAIVVIKSSKELKRYLAKINKAIDFFKDREQGLDNKSKLLLKVLQSIR